MEAKGRSLDRPEIIQFGNGLRLALSIRPGASVSIWAKRVAAALVADPCTRDERK